MYSRMASSFFFILIDFGERETQTATDGQLYFSTTLKVSILPGTGQ
jgi:hypothetical protein